MTAYLLVQLAVWLVLTGAFATFFWHEKAWDEWTSILALAFGIGQIAWTVALLI
jgi:hypothetical protein